MKKQRFSGASGNTAPLTFFLLVILLSIPMWAIGPLAERYLSIEHKGEAILSVGKAIEMYHEGVSGIVNAMPFNCMPGTVVSSLSKRLSDDHDFIPWLNISYEGLRDSGEETRLEAFAEQVRAYVRGRQKAGDPDSITAHKR